MSELTKRESEMLDLLLDALWEIETELGANDDSEIRSNPLLYNKRLFVERAKRKIDIWRAMR